METVAQRQLVLGQHGGRRITSRGRVSSRPSPHCRGRAATKKMENDSVTCWLWPVESIGGGTGFRGGALGGNNMSVAI